VVGERQAVNSFFAKPSRLFIVCDEVSPPSNASCSRPIEREFGFRRSDTKKVYIKLRYLIFCAPRGKALLNACQLSWQPPPPKSLPLHRTHSPPTLVPTTPTETCCWATKTRKGFPTSVASLKAMKGSISYLWYIACSCDVVTT